MTIHAIAYCSKSYKRYYCSVNIDNDFESKSVIITGKKYFCKRLGPGLLIHFSLL